MSLMDREYLTQPEKVARSLVAEKCAGCVIAFEVAQQVIEEAIGGKVHLLDVRDEYELRIHSMCSKGLIKPLYELDLDFDEIIVEEEPLPTLRALD